MRRDAGDGEAFGSRGQACNAATFGGETAHFGVNFKIHALQKRLDRAIGNCEEFFGGDLNGDVKISEFKCQKAHLGEAGGLNDQELGGAFFI